MDIAWLIDCQSRTVEVFEGEAGGVPLAGDESLQSPLLPGFELSLLLLFAAMD